VVGVLSDLDALEAAIRWRRGAPQRRLLVGPNVAALPSFAPALMTAPEIDVCVVPSEWVKREFERDSPDLIGRLAVWPAGVDVERWRPDGGPPGQTRRAVMFVKRLANHTTERAFDDAMLDATRQGLERAGVEVMTLKYGHFGPDAFARALDGAELMVCFGCSETQGMALAEAWAMDVPTLVWNGGNTTWREHTYQSSPAPYLSAATGAEFRTIDELQALLERWDSPGPGFEPRDWVLANMTNVICAQWYWDLAHTLDGR
jgi:glycosyltransferase involved in cell wall biosynthesis